MTDPLIANIDASEAEAASRFHRVLTGAFGLGEKPEGEEPEAPEGPEDSATFP